MIKDDFVGRIAKATGKSKKKVKKQYVTKAKHMSFLDGD